MPRSKLKLTTQYFIILWSLASLPIFLSLYYPLKLIRYPVKSEIRLPEEYRLFLEFMPKVDKAPTQMRKIEIDTKENPFADTLPRTSKIMADKNFKREEVIKLSTIINHERKACIINQKLFREGDRIGKIKIEKIGDYYVDLWLPNKKRVRLEVGSTYTFVE